MYQAIEVPCRLFDCFSHLILAFYLQHIGDKVEGILIILHLCVEGCKVEAVVQILVVDIAKVLVASRISELDVKC